ncbi:hypothetical protein CO678_35085 [Bradyrhizobium diazoefficiens]|uniref:hypothetical protein n=1 Tax=Bradyrhizobium diazoefficiens TaxID=1355477 RepID=UPI000BE79669|nr:hypothetical protein [Bradyrhizobium diazoefficiens]PDT57105.1 hypothetical protein CO678_35085 [Bradyrhizobium diazoefficiens]
MKKFPGLTREECASACSEKGCVLAVGRPFCFHPCKGGVPKAFKDDPEAQAIQADARAALGIKLKPLEGVTA